MSTLKQIGAAYLSAIFAAFALLSACGGGGSSGSGITLAGGDGGGTGGTGVAALSVSEGVMRKGSIIVNRVRFDDSIATVTIDDSPRTTADLKDGMVVKVKGVINSDQVSGSAELVKVVIEVRGTVQGVSPDTNPAFFTVLGQKVFVDETTIFANITGATVAARVALLGTTSVVEVHGQRDAAGNIRASRVELFTASAPPDELRGIISALTTTTFTVNGFTVQYAATVIQPAGATIVNGQSVEVRGTTTGGVLVATRINREDLFDTAFVPDASGKLEVEGFVTSFTVTPGSFFVNGRAVRTTSTTRFEGGGATELLNNVAVEAEGPVVSGVLVADKIQFKRTRVLLTGIATAIDTMARTVTVFGQVIHIDDLTELNTSSSGSGGGGGIGGSLAALPVGNRVEMRGYTNGAGTIIAERLDDKGNGGGGSNNDVVQGRVTAKNQIGRTLSLLGVNASLSGASVVFRQSSGGPISEAAFYAAVTPTVGTTPGTLVKVKGTFSGGTFAVSEAEIEN